MKSLEFGNSIKSLNDLYCTFDGCGKLEAIDLSNLVGSENVTNAGRAFGGCENLKTLKLSGLDFRNLNSGFEFSLSDSTKLEAIYCPAYIPSRNIALPITMYDTQGNAYTNMPGGNITIYKTNPTL